MLALYMSIMKIKIFLGIILISATLKAQEGWFTQQAPSSVHNLKAIFALNSNIVFAVGDSCKIIKSTDGGETWKKTGIR